MILQMLIQSESEKFSVFSVVRAFGTKRAKVTRKEVFAAAKALDEAGLLMVCDDTFSYIGPSWRDLCRRCEGRE